MTPGEEIEAAFKLVCRKCGSDEARIFITEAEDFGGETGIQSGSISVGCNACKRNDVYVSI